MKNFSLIYEWATGLSNSPYCEDGEGEETIREFTLKRAIAELKKVNTIQHVFAVRSSIGTVHAIPKRFQ